MTYKILGMAALAATVATAAFSHGGATGVVKERMDGMMAMGDAVKTIAPMMRGEGAYDAEQVRGLAEEIRAHAGEAMIKLFPEGTMGKPSEAKAAIWTDREGFEALAEQLKVYTEGLSLAADNGVVGTSAPASGMMGRANMMGSSGSMAGSAVMMGGEAAMMGLEEIAEMPADSVFMMVSQTCSACHTKFREESK